jgi:hypothetical protein
VLNINEVPSYAQNAVKTPTDETAEGSLSYLKFNSNHQFSISIGGEEKKLGSEVSIVILSVTPPQNFINARAYWPGKFDPSNSSPPDCGSPNGVKPFSFLESPQAKICDKCKQAVQGSAESQGASGKSTQCRQFKFIYFVFADDVKGGIHALRVPVSALKNLGDYRFSLKGVGAPIAGVSTKVSFDPEPEYTRPMFSYEKFLPEKELHFCTKLAVSDEMGAITGSSGAQITASAIEDKSAAEEAVAHQEEKSVDDWVSEPTTKEAEAVKEVEGGDLLDGLFEAEPEKEVLTAEQAFKIEVDCTTTFEELKAYINAEGKDLLQKMSTEERVSCKTYAKERAIALKRTVETVSPVVMLRTELEAITKLIQLPPILKRIRSIGGEAMNLVSLFTDVASKLNGVVFNTKIHGLSKDGFPALKADGFFRQKKGLLVQEKPETEIDDDILGDLEEA